MIEKMKPYINSTIVTLRIVFHFIYSSSLLSFQLSTPPSTSQYDLHVCTGSATSTQECVFSHSPSVCINLVHILLPLYRNGVLSSYLLISLILFVFLELFSEKLLINAVFLLLFSYVYNLVFIFLYRALLTNNSLRVLFYQKLDLFKEKSFFYPYVN